MDSIYSKLLIVQCLLSGKGCKLIAYICVLVVGLIGLFALLVSSVTDYCKRWLLFLVSISVCREYPSSG